MLPEPVLLRLDFITGKNVNTGIKFEYMLRVYKIK
jgi:hypothetical protein